MIEIDALFDKLGYVANDSSSSSRERIRRARCVIVQNKKRIVKPAATQFIALIIIGTASTEGARSDAKRASIIKRGAPGGWPTSNLYEVAINSLQSQRLVVGSIVSRYERVAIAKTSQPKILFQRVYSLIFSKSFISNCKYNNICPINDKKRGKL